MKNLTQLLFTLFCLCLPAMLQAQDRDDSKYLAGAVPVSYTHLTLPTT